MPSVWLSDSRRVPATHSRILFVLEQEHLCLYLAPGEITLQIVDMQAYQLARENGVSQTEEKEALMIDIVEQTYTK